MSSYKITHRPGRDDRGGERYGMAKHEVTLTDELEKQLQVFAASLRKPVEVAIVEAIKRSSAPPRRHGNVIMRLRRR